MKLKVKGKDKDKNREHLLQNNNNEKEPYKKRKKHLKGWSYLQNVRKKCEEQLRKLQQKVTSNEERKIAQEWENQQQTHLRPTLLK